jgi:hypothetical protein
MVSYFPLFFVTSIVEFVLLNVKIVHIFFYHYLTSDNNWWLQSISVNWNKISAEKIINDGFSYSENV